jgi:hydrogenase nickel incorporation protein HypA/HybF
MHELGLAGDLFLTILEMAGKNHLIKITRIVLRSGIASGIEKDFLIHSFRDHVLPGTIAEGAEIILLDEPLIIRCRNCERDIQDSDRFSLDCPFCGSPDIEILKGLEIKVETIAGE